VSIGQDQKVSARVKHFWNSSVQPCDFSFVSNWLRGTAIWANLSLIPDPCLISTLKELNRIAEKKICKTASDLKNDFDAIGFYRDRLKFMVFITHFGIFIPKRLDFGNSNGPVYMQRLSDYVYGDIEYVCVYIDDILTTVQAIEKLFREVFQMTRDAQLRIAVYEVRFLVLIMWDSTLQKMGSNSKRSMLCSSRCQDY